MPYDIRVISIKDFLRTQVSGEMDLEKSKKILTKIAIECSEANCHHVLLDVRDVKKPLSISDLYQLAKSLRDIGLTVDHKVAFLIPVERFDKGSFFQLCAQNRGYNISAFTRFESAFNWLNELNIPLKK